VIAIYFVMVIWIGFYLKAVKANTSEEFFMAGPRDDGLDRGLSFVSANLGSLELMGWAGSAYQYGILAAHWYWIGAIPAMLFLGMVMMPFYYVCKTHSVPGYLKLRYGQGASTVAAFLVRLHDRADERREHVRHGRGDEGGSGLGSELLDHRVVAGGCGVCGARRASLGHLQRGAAVHADLGRRAAGADSGLVECGGWTGFKASLAHNIATGLTVVAGDYTHMWRSMGHFADNPMGIHWTGIVFGLGFAISFGYWTTDFLVVQRVLAARTTCARRAWLR
jgi:SSS family solute:Na+ symporter